MKLISHGVRLALACALLIIGGCERHMVVDEGGGNAGAGAGQAGEGGDAGEAGHAGEAGDGSAGEAGAGEGGSAGEAGAAGDGSAGTAGGEAGAAGGDGVGGQFGDQPPVTTRWTGNDAACPAEPVYEGACEVEGLVCGYYGSETGDPEQTQYSECACRMSCTADGTEMQWECYGNSGGRLDVCPAEQPEEDSSCFGLKGVQCYYPVGVACGCPRDESDSTWHCEYERLPPPEHPTVVDEDTVVSEMTAEERAAWCAWYAPPEDLEPGFPPPPEREPTEDGFYPDTGCTTTQVNGCGTRTPGGLPASACEANLALSTCTATVRELNDCVLTAEGAAPAPNGCARYLNTPGCSGTLVNSDSGNGIIPAPGDNACLVRVE